MFDVLFNTRRWNENKIVYAFWGLVDFFLLGAGIICLAVSFIWRRPNDPFFHLQITREDLNGGFALGIMFLVSFVVSLAGILQPKPHTSILKIFNLFLIADSVAIVVVGTLIWFQTLIIIDYYQDQWNSVDDTTRVFFQDKFSCCGYQNGTQIVLAGNFCSNATFAAEQMGCVAPIIEAGQYTLGQTFTVIYGFMPVTLSLLLATLVVINKRVEEDRYRKIDEKRGDGSYGFV